MYSEYDEIDTFLGKFYQMVLQAVTKSLVNATMLAEVLVDNSWVQIDQRNEYSNSSD